MKIKKRIQLIDQHDKDYMYGGKFGGNFIPETLKKPIDDLTKLFTKLRKDKIFLKERNYYFKNYIGTPTPFIKLEKSVFLFLIRLNFRRLRYFILFNSISCPLIYVLIRYKNSSSTLPCSCSNDNNKSAAGKLLEIVLQKI